eukprot:scaffold1781_cov416-Prasinococcus_capsulatus_cf.AAC.13
MTVSGGECRSGPPGQSRNPCHDTTCLRVPARFRSKLEEFAWLRHHHRGPKDNDGIGHTGKQGSHSREPSCHQHQEAI